MTKFKFDRYSTSSFFIDCWNRDARIIKRFERAFSHKDKVRLIEDEKTKKMVPRVVGRVVFMDDRRWVQDVFLIFAEKMEVSLPQAWQAFKSGDHLALRRIHQRIAESLSFDERKIQTIVNGEVIEEHAHPSIKWAKLDRRDFESDIRQHFGWALGVRHATDKVTIRGTSETSTIADTVKKAVEVQLAKGKVILEAAE
jgi:hypothetical protein